jgi:hypothetical protein
MRRVLRLGLLVVAGFALACGPHDATTRLTFSGSALGPEGDVVRRQLARFAERRPGVRVELQVTPDSADQRHQLYVQWLNAHAPMPDVLQLDVIWMSEFAAAGWILPLHAFEPGVDDFLPAALAAPLAPAASCTPPSIWWSRVATTICSICASIRQVPTPSLRSSPGQRRRLERKSFSRFHPTADTCSTDEPVPDWRSRATRYGPQE